MNTSHYVKLISIASEDETALTLVSLIEESHETDISNILQSKET